MKSIFLLFLFSTSIGISQNLNQYKYAKIPAKMSYMKDENEYGISALAKAMMEKYGFESYYDNETLPEDFAKDNCNKVFVDIVNNSTVFVTKMKVVLKDCKNNILAESPIGTSREKDYFTAYQLATRNAFDNFAQLKFHKFNPVVTQPIVVSQPEITSTNLYKIQDLGTHFNLIDKSGREALRCFGTSHKEVFFAQNLIQNVSGVASMKDNKVKFEYFNGKEMATAWYDLE